MTVPERHTLLRRQLRRLAPSGTIVPPEWEPLFEAVDQAYRQFDEDRSMLERSLDLSSEELLQANTDMQGIFQAFPDFFFRLRADGTILDRKGRQGEHSGRIPPRIVGTRIQDVEVPGLGERFESALAALGATGEVANLEYSCPSPDGESYWEARFVPLPSGEVVALIRDITQRQRLARQLAQAQKMEAIGRLAGGIAHDFNNLLTIILGYCEILRDEVESDDARESVTAILRASERAAELTSQLLAFSRKQLLKPRILSLNEVIARLPGMLDRLIGEDIRIDRYLASDLGRIRADPGQLEQVIVNLAVNARDAMKTGGTLHLATRNTTLRQRPTGQRAVMEPGDYVVLTIQDTGCGMDAATCSRIFEPFFTTKLAGQGTGLGLATVYGIVKQSGGYIWANSKVGSGTTFEVFFPCLMEEPSGTDDGRETVGHPTSQHRQASGTILLVEDEDALRRVVQRTLEARGYRTLVAGTGREAMRIADEHSGPIDLLLTDVVLPDHPGPIVAERLRGCRPSLEVLFISGYTGNELHRRGAFEAGSSFLQKPFTRRALLERIDQQLRSGRQNGDRVVAERRPQSPNGDPGPAGVEIRALAAVR